MKKIYTKQGIGKYNKPYLLTKIQGETGEYFTSFKPELVKEIKEGMNLLLEADETDRKGYFNIIKIISFGSTHPADQNEGRGGNLTNPHPNPNPTNETFQKLEKELEINPEEVKAQGIAYVETNLRDAIGIVREGFKLKPEDSLVEYSDLIAELMHEMYSLYITKEIQQSKLKNMGLIK